MPKAKNSNNQNDRNLVFWPEYVNFDTLMIVIRKK